MKAIGFTGTRRGTTIEQHKAMRQEISRGWRADIQMEFHHGDCRGSDEEAHAVAWSLGYRIVVHPPVIHTLRAWVDRGDYWDVGTGDIVLPEKHYLERNRDIVDTSAVLIATPDAPEAERAGSGTWATIRYARSKNVPTIIVMPDGSIA